MIYLDHFDALNTIIFRVRINTSLTFECSKYSVLKFKHLRIYLSRTYLSYYISIYSDNFDALNTQNFSYAFESF